MCCLHSYAFDVQELAFNKALFAVTQGGEAQMQGWIRCGDDGVPATTTTRLHRHRCGRAWSCIPAQRCTSSSSDRCLPIPCWPLAYDAKPSQYVDLANRCILADACTVIWNTCLDGLSLLEPLDLAIFQCQEVVFAGSVHRSFGGPFSMP
jgi:hypothetical protein